MADLLGIVERLSALTVTEAGELGKMLQEKWGVSAALTAAPAVSPTVIAEAEPEQSEFDLILTSYGEQKVQVVRVVRTIVGLGLKESMDLVNTVPVSIKTALSKTEADRFKGQIEEVGGTVEIK